MTEKPRLLRVNPAVEARFLKYVKKATNGCWLWIGSMRGPYGNIKIKIDDVLETSAHRVAFAMWKGPIPAGKHVLHKRKCCYKKICVQPDHLYAGTRKDNAQDALA